MKKNLIVIMFFSVTFIGIVVLLSIHPVIAGICCAAAIWQSIHQDNKNRKGDIHHA
jgi:hypothetical protein